MIRAIHYATGEAIEIRLKGGVITAIEALADGGEDATEELPIASPGLVDLQINGYQGRDFNRLPLSADSASECIRLLWAQGVTACYPTVITNDADAIEQAMAAIAEACDSDPLINGCIAGIHLEGPFISPEDGARGAHDRRHVRPPDWELFSRWQRASGGRIKIVTLSPEWSESREFIRRCAVNGVIASIGHTSATSEQIREAVGAGARMSTHLGNGAQLMLPRHPNYLWEQLADDRLWCCLIADGFHLPEQFLKVALRVKGHKALLVSDAVALAGMEPGGYETPVGGRVVLTPEGKLHLADNPLMLAGSASMLTDGIAHLTKSGLAEWPEAWNMASVRPSALMGLPTAFGLTPCAPADLVLLRRSPDGRAEIEQTFKSGVRVY